MSTSSLIQAPYTIRATIFEKVFWPEKFPQANISLLKESYHFQAELVSFQISTTQHFKQTSDNIVSSIHLVL